MTLLILLQQLCFFFFPFLESIYFFVYYVYQKSTATSQWEHELLEGKDLYELFIAEFQGLEELLPSVRCSNTVCYRNEFISRAFILNTPSVKSKVRRVKRENKLALEG